MKAISNMLLLFMAACGLAFAEEKSCSGFLRIINAVAQGSGKAAFAIDGRDVYADGYTLGQTTGEYGVRTGGHVITVRKAGVETGHTSIQLKDGETVTLVAYAEQLPPKELSDPPKWALRLLRMRQQDESKGFALTLVSVCKAEETVVNLLSADSGAVEKAFLKRLAIIKRDLERKRGEVFIRMGDRVLTSILPESPGNNVVIFYEDREGRIEVLSYYDPKLLAEG